MERLEVHGKALKSATKSDGSFRMVAWDRVVTTRMVVDSRSLWWMALVVVVDRFGSFARSLVDCCGGPYRLGRSP